MSESSVMKWNFMARLKMVMYKYLESESDDLQDGDVNLLRDKEYMVLWSNPKGLASARALHPLPELPDNVRRASGDVRCTGIPADVREQEIRPIRTKSKLERKQWRTTKGRGGGDKSIGINPKTSGGRREGNSSRMEEGMSRV
ncbi:hypothetical protein C8R48DRAFT_678984 [Suillus tomentosus]|nr:hypothetical protein C8R48DRAFT_678984 [Suillus tomentosus]